VQASNNYDGFQHLDFIFSQKITSLLCKGYMDYIYLYNYCMHNNIGLKINYAFHYIVYYIAWYYVYVFTCCVPIIVYIYIYI